MFKRILSALICAAVMCTSSFAYTKDAFKDEETGTEETAPSSDGQNGVKTELPNPTEILNPQTAAKPPEQKFLPVR